MPRYILKVKDHYILWSTIVDAPIGVFELHQIDFLKSQYYEGFLPQFIEPGKFEEYLDRANKIGHSVKEFDLIQRIESYNRAGPEKSMLSLDEIYKAYCLMERVRGWSPYS